MPKQRFFQTNYLKENGNTPRGGLQMKDRIGAVE